VTVKNGLNKKKPVVYHGDIKLILMKGLSMKALGKKLRVLAYYMSSTNKELHEIF
jgi:hypothetical protein